MMALWRFYIFVRFIWPYGGGRALAHECAVPHPKEVEGGDD